MKKILMVCTGNICRSPTADGIMRQMIADQGLADRFVVDSCGIMGWHVGKKPDSRSIATAKSYGVDLSDLRARQLDRKDYYEFDWILGMTGEHMDALEANAPADGTAKLSLFRAMEEGAPDLPDPYYGDIQGFDVVYRMLEKGCGDWLEKIKAEG